jgi:Domain of unknown function (DUF4123)
MEVSLEIVSGVSEAQGLAIAERDKRPTPEPLLPGSRISQTRNLLDILRTQPQPLFAILDAARDPKALEILKNCDQPYQSLYEGAKAEGLADFAPYLVEFSSSSALIDTLVLEAWGKSWGIFLTSESGFKETRRHFRHFLLVQAYDARRLYFRFYDPRVLRAFLPTCTPQEIKEFFGPLGSFLLEAEEPTHLIQFTQAGGNVAQKIYPLQSKHQRISPGSLFLLPKEIPHKASQVCRDILGNTMFTIRKEQFEMFQMASLRQFEHKMILHLRTEFADQAKSKADSEQRTLVEMGIKRAAFYKILMEADVSRYLECMFRWGQNFDLNPDTNWAGQVLRTRSLTGTEKMNYIEQLGKQRA